MVTYGQEDDKSMAFDLLGDESSDSREQDTSFARGLSRSFRRVTPPVKERLLRVINDELSSLAAEADGVSEKVKKIINRQRQRLDSLIEETSKAPRRLQFKITAPLDKRRRQFHGKIRKAVTGDPLKSVRLHLEEKRSKPFAMRMLDKAAFTVGVLTMIVSEYVLLMMPERFWLWYSVMVPVLLLMRYPDYRQRKWLFFYYDFCYYFWCMVAIFVMPHSCRLLKSIFIFVMGSLLWAVPLWRNSLVFHDVDKMTSCFIHLFPSWLALTLRWYPLDPMRGGTAGAEPECQDGIDMRDVGTAMAMYLAWQVLYFFKTEIADKPKLDADPEIQTSLRWLTTSPSNPMHKIVLALMRKIGMFKKDETFDPTTFKTKMIFMGSQLVFTVLVSLPTPFLYNSKWASTSLAFFVFLCALWNSSNYYIEVFSRRYWQSMEAESAAKAEALVVKATMQRERERLRSGEDGIAAGGQMLSASSGGSREDLADDDYEDGEDWEEEADAAPAADEEEEEAAEVEAVADMDGLPGGELGAVAGENPGQEKSKDV
ncbi:unnamed protein product [Ectocarpus sp. CCAP 1310/34]|nr:unnamed protein product [Ectocarpus sp. CCAP 1310/34]